MDGAEASFLAGGEFPVPIIQGSGTAANVTIVFKEFGIRLTFKPTIIDEQHIRLELLPEVSTIDFGNGVSFSGFRIPALRTRRSKTSVELSNSQSFVLAGLLDASETKALSKVPLLGDIPFLGYAFRSESLQKAETEIVFIITVKLVKPVDRSAIPAMPGLEDLKGDKSPLTKTPNPDAEKEKEKKNKDDKDKKDGNAKKKSGGDDNSPSSTKEKP
jgi:pilus assembly protein CpaC